MCNVDQAALKLGIEGKDIGDDLKLGPPAVAAGQLSPYAEAEANEQNTHYLHAQMLFSNFLASASNSLFEYHSPEGLGLKLRVLAPNHIATNAFFGNAESSLYWCLDSSGWLLCGKCTRGSCHLVW